MIYLLYTLHIIICLFLILVVLLQQGKGADLSVFGGGTTMTSFGVRSATTIFTVAIVVRAVSSRKNLVVASSTVFTSVNSLNAVRSKIGGATISRKAPHSKPDTATQPL